MSNEKLQNKLDELISPIAEYRKSVRLLLTMLLKEILDEGQHDQVEALLDILLKVTKSECAGEACKIIIASKSPVEAIEAICERIIKAK